LLKIKPAAAYFELCVKSLKGDENNRLMGLLVIPTPNRDKSKRKRINDIDISNWKREIKEKEIIVDSLWIFPNREKSGGHTNEYWGNFIPQIVYQALMRYTCKGDWVLDLFAGSGTTLIECKRCGRNGVGVELIPQVAAKANQLIKAQENPKVFAEVIAGDSTSVKTRRRVKGILTAHNVSQVQLIMLHPPYHNIIRFSDDPRDLSNAPSIPIFLKKLKRVVKNFADLLEEGRYMILVMGDLYLKGEYIPLGFRCMDVVLATGLFKLKATNVKNINGNRGKIGQENLWQYRSLKEGLYLFKHEYIYVFQKI
jgi:hypothetical protein